MRHKDISRLRHSGNIAAAGLYPVNPDDGKGTVAVKETEKKGTLPAEARHEGGDGSGRGELEEGGVPPYSRELEGAPTMVRRELSS